MIPTCFLYRTDPMELFSLLPNFKDNGAQCQIHTRGGEVIRGKVQRIIHVPVEQELHITFEWYCSRGFAKKPSMLKNARWTVSQGSLEGKTYTVAFVYEKFYEQRTKDKVNGRVKLKGPDELCWLFPPDDPSNIDIAKVLKA